MAGRGPAPKDPSQRARRNKDAVPTTYLKFVRGTIPKLPRDIDWHPRAREWWDTWVQSAQAELMTDVDWQVMLSTALLVHQFWYNGRWDFAAEIRLREAKFGATPEDRARLRIQFAEADDADSKRPEGSIEQAKRQARYGELKVLPTAGSGDGGGA